MGELAIGALAAATLIYGMSGFAKLRGRDAYRAYRAGLAATTLVRPRLAAASALALAGSEAAVAAGCAGALVMAFAPARGGVTLTVTALSGAAVLACVLTAGVAVVLRRGVAAPCACFGAVSASRQLGGVHLVRNACLLAAFGCGAAAAGAGPGHVALPAAALAATAGAAAALLLSRLDELTALFSGVAAQ